MKTNLIGRAILGSLAVSLSVSAGDVSVGSTRQEVLRAYGQPNGEMDFGGQTTLFYPGGEVVLENGRVVEIPAGFQQQNQVAVEEKARRDEAAKVRQEAAKARQEAAKAREKEAEKRDPLRRYVDALRSEAQGNTNRTVFVFDSIGGPADSRKRPPTKQLPNHNRLIRRGKTSVVFFSADWCPACRHVRPIVSVLREEFPEVYWNEVVISSWDSLYCSRYDVDSLPSFRVFDASGDLICGATSSLRAVVHSLE